MVRRSRKRHWAWLLVLAACGSRTGLFGEDGTVPFPPGDGGPFEDVTPIEGGRDNFVPDVIPPIDVIPPQDVIRNDCPDADATLVYVVTQQYELYSFYPPDGTFKAISNISCPAPGGSTPFSMAVDRKGIAYVVFDDGHLYRVSTATGACIATTFAVDQHNFHTFGMGYATNFLGPSETLYVAGEAPAQGGSVGLGSINTTSFVLNPVGPFVPEITLAELTGTGDGRLFAFYTRPNIAGSFVGELDKTNAHLVGETPFPTLDQGSGWAFAFWGGDFYLFTAPGGNSQVSRYRPSTGAINVVAKLNTVIVGAGVSTCAPQQ